MAYYIKANPKVAAHLGVETMRRRLRDGNYLLWQADLLPLGSAADLPEITRSVGGLLLTHKEALAEIEGRTCRALPAATDARFAVANK